MTQGANLMPDGRDLPVNIKGVFQVWRLLRPTKHTVNSMYSDIYTWGDNSGIGKVHEHRIELTPNLGVHSILPGRFYELEGCFHRRPGVDPCVLSELRYIAATAKPAKFVYPAGVDMIKVCDHLNGTVFVTSTGRVTSSLVRTEPGKSDEVSVFGKFEHNVRDPSGFREPFVLAFKCPPGPGLENRVADFKINAIIKVQGYWDVAKYLTEGKIASVLQVTISEYTVLL